MFEIKIRRLISIYGFYIDPFKNPVIEPSYVSLCCPNRVMELLTFQFA